jgi:hypothetical protein
MKQKPTIGKTVIWRGLDAQKREIERPAVVVRVWGDTEESCVNLQIFTDGNGDPLTNDGLPQVFWKTSVGQDPSGVALNSFRFPSRE